MLFAHLNCWILSTGGNMAQRFKEQGYRSTLLPQWLGAEPSLCPDIVPARGCVPVLAVRHAADGAARCH